MTGVRYHLLLGAFWLVLAGCSDPDERTVLEYMVWGDRNQLGVEEQLIEVFEQENPGVKVRIMKTPYSGYLQKIQVMLASQTAPDVIRVDQYHFPSLATRGWFRPLDALAAADPQFDPAHFHPRALDECRVDGRLMAMNTLFGSRVIYYNKSLFQAAGLPDPFELHQQGEWTLTAMKYAARQLTQLDPGTQRTTRIGLEMQELDFFSLVWAHGGRVISSDLTECVVADAAGEAALQWLIDGQDQGWLRFRLGARLEALTFESGRIAMHVQWAGATPRFRTLFEDFEWDVVPMPSGPGGHGTVLKGNQLVVSGNSTQPELAWKFIRFMTSAETEQLYCGQLRRAIPTRLDILESPAYQQATEPPFQNQTWIDAVDTGRVLPINQRWTSWQPSLQLHLDMALRGVPSPLNPQEPISAREALRLMQEDVNRILSEEPY